MSANLPTAAEIANAVTQVLTPGSVTATQSAAPAPSSAFLGGYGYHLTHVISEFTILGGLLGSLYLEGLQATTFGPFTGLVQLATAVAGLVGMTFGHVSFTASMSGVQVTK